MPEETCKKCKGTGRYMYDEIHLTVCDACCTHPDGWHKIEGGHGKYICKKGCGAIRESVPQSESDLIELTKQALTDVLGRAPTEQETLRAHASFKRMAAIMYDHLQQSDKS